MRARIALLVLPFPLLACGVRAVPMQTDPATRDAPPATSGHRVLAEGTADRTGFEQRRLSGRGRFLAAPEIAARHASRVSDLFVGVAAVAIVDLANGGVALSTSPEGRARSYSTNGAASAACWAALYLDGVRLTPAGSDAPFDINTLQVRALRGVEVYRASEAPAQYSSPQRCPVVLFWS